MAASVFLALVTVLLFLPVARAEIKTTPIATDPRSVILFEEFGFKPGGHATVSVTGVTWRVPEGSQLQAADPSLMGFILISNSLFFNINNESEYAEASGGAFCPLTSKYVLPLFRLKEIAPDGTGKGSVTIDAADQYTVLFSSCQEGVEVTMDVRTEMYNVRRSGAKEYLPVGLLPLPGIFAATSAVHFVFLGAWVYVCVNQRKTAERIHAVMGALLLFKALKLACAAEDSWYVERTGTPHGWDVAFYVFGFFKGILLFTVIVLIGTGWSFLKPFLQDREKNVLMIIIPLQVIENIASAVIGETGPAGRDWLAWNQIFLLVDVICCCAVFFPIIWSIRNLREASKTDGKAARNLQKLTLFKQFYLVVVCYLYFTRIAVSAFAAVLSYKYRWVVNVAVEMASLAFYVFVFYNFQPVEKNPYLYVGDDEEDAAGGQLELESTFEI
ncbi:protein CANDIDATE G-PROTEIN COUPLED RECEPTOR 7-like [Phragmites australis]|uniref:protein CANDIDATE G-PROTEIN COUPLED RECEPTOR 7-like n=1 Tax=Phragmites australis TaxID=29695 RepID=UPI002D7A082F|nr:protein CANDIDATE G-PROTEIN COUPLED RECEPTOR 7-like [Phragmites australis]